MENKSGNESGHKIVKIAINKGIFANLESLAKARGVSMELQFDHAFTFLLGFYTLTKKERIKIMDLMADGKHL